MIVLKIIGIVLLSIIALIILILCVKVRIFAEYSEIDTRVRLQWLFIKIPLYPIEKKSAKKKDESKNLSSDEAVENTVEPEELNLPDDATDVQTEDTADASQEEAPLTEEKAAPKSTLLKDIYESHGIDGLLLVLRKVFSYIGTFVGQLMNSLVIDELYVDVRCTKSDAAQTALYYGEVCSSLFPMMGALITKYKVRKYDINVYPDFLARHSSASFAVSLHFYPIYLIGITLGLVFKLIFKVLIGFIVKLIKYNKNKGVNKTETKSVENK